MSEVIRVLVVDDSAYVRKVVRQMLSQDPAIEVVGTARNGEEALELVERLEPDVVTCDLIMPEMDGFEFAENLRKNEQWRSIPVIIITSKDLTPDEIGRLNGNVERILRKESYAYSDLLGEIHRIAAHSGREHGK
mgnify:CR=1 FL=1